MFRHLLMGTLALAGLWATVPLSLRPSVPLSLLQAADSARVAREAYRAAIPLYRRGEYGAAREQLRRAFTAWPAQQVYVRSYAALSARVQDTAEAVRALTLLADLGLTADLDVDSDFAALRAVPAVQAVASRLAANAQPLIQSRVAATLPEPDFFAEGISHDPRRGVWYVASIRHRKVSRIDSAGVAVDVIKPGQHDLWRCSASAPTPSRQRSGSLPPPFHRWRVM